MQANELGTLRGSTTDYAGGSRRVSKANSDGQSEDKKLLYGNDEFTKSAYRQRGRLCVFKNWNKEMKG